MTNDKEVDSYSAESRAFADADPDTWLSAATEAESQKGPFCFEHRAEINAEGVITCATCGASEEAIIAEQEAQFEAAKALGTYPDVDMGDDDDDWSDSDRDAYAYDREDE